MSLGDILVKTKMKLLVAFCCIGLCIIGVLGYFNMGMLNNAVGEANTSVIHVAMLSDIEKQFLLIRIDYLYMMSLSDLPGISAKAEDIVKRRDRIHKIVQDFEKYDLDPEEKKLIKDFKEGFAEYVTNGTKLYELLKSAASSGQRQDHAAAIVFAAKTVAPLYDKPAKAIEDIVKENVVDAEKSSKQHTVSYHKAATTMIIFVVVCCILASSFGVVIVRSVLRPLFGMVEMLRDIAQGEGDLTKRLNISSKDEIGEVAHWFNTFVDKLHSIISEVAHNTVQVSAAASQMQVTSAQMATGAEQAAVQVSTAATAGEQMAATSGNIAQICQRAAEGSTNANESAVNGSRVVDKTVTVMATIAERVKSSAQTIESLGSRSDQIGAIIGTIEEIADQTNLLALNAAIEAARAGEQGRGFAVVADEVRALAERTSKATREISGMIKAIQSDTKQAVATMVEGVAEVETGTAEAAKSGRALEEILEQINAVSIQVNQIAAAADEQTATTSEISKNMLQITEVIQSTSRGANESASAALQLAHLSEELRSLVGQFKLAG